MNSSYILSAGLMRCYNEDGDVIECRGSGQDAEFMTGIDWPVMSMNEVEQDIPGFQSQNEPGG